jgi:phytoene/squalene synthetase
VCVAAQVVSLADYNKYCFYVAGLVGVGLSRLFSAGSVFRDTLPWMRHAWPLL